MSDWVDLRAGGKMHGRLHLGQMVLEVRQHGQVFHYDLVATVQARRSVVERVRVSANIDEGGEKLSGRPQRGAGGGMVGN